MAHHDLGRRRKHLQAVLVHPVEAGVAAPSVAVKARPDSRGVQPRVDLVGGEARGRGALHQSHPTGSAGTFVTAPGVALDGTRAGGLDGAALVEELGRHGVTPSGRWENTYASRSRPVPAALARWKAGVGWPRRADTIRSLVLIRDLDHHEPRRVAAAVQQFDLAANDSARRRDLLVEPPDDRVVCCAVAPACERAALRGRLARPDVLPGPSEQRHLVWALGVSRARWRPGVVAGRAGVRLNAASRWSTIGSMSAGRALVWTTTRR